MLLVLLALWSWRAAQHRRLAICFSLALWMVEAALAAYHVGVEQQWWHSATGCSSAGGANSLAALRAQIMNAPLVSCDVPELVVFGLSMAGWNVVYSLTCILLLGRLHLRYRCGKECGNETK